MEPLSASALRWSCDANLLEFDTTEQSEKLDCVFGQHRAVEAIQFGIAIHREGYNIFALGPQGAGKQRQQRRRAPATRLRTTSSVLIARSAILRGGAART